VRSLLIATSLRNLHFTLITINLKRLLIHN
jgi:hypothetical protein